MSTQMQALIEALRGADPSTVRQLRDALASTPEEVQAVNPCDHGHEWSDVRKSHTGKRIGRSCVRCGVLAIHTGEAHGELTADEASDDAATAVAAALAPASVSAAPAVSTAEAKPAATKKKKTG